MTIQEMLDTIESLNSECLYNLPNFTFDEVCENFIKGKFPDSVDDEQVVKYYHDGAGADSIKSEMSSIKGNLNKAGKNITAIQSCFKKQDENVIVFGTNEIFMAQLEDVILSMSKALSSAVGLVYQLPNDVLNILEEMKKIKEEIEKYSIDIFEYFKKQQDDTDNIKKEIEDINKEIGGFTPGMTDDDWKRVNGAIQSGIDSAVGTDSAIQKEINSLLEELRKQGVAIDNLGHSHSAAKLQAHDKYIEGTVANLGLNQDGTIDYSRTHLVMTSDEAYLTAQKIKLDSYGNVTNIRTAGLVLQSDYIQDITEQFESEDAGAVRAEQTEEQVIVLIYDAEELEEPQRTHRVYKIEPGYQVKVKLILSKEPDQSDLYGVCMCDATGMVLEYTDNETNYYTFTRRDDTCYLWVSDKYVESVSLLTDSGTFSTLFAQAVEKDTNIVKQAQISAFVSKTEDGYLESGVLIKADNIKLEGYISANNGFTIDTNGSITATSGKIGGFEISQNYLGIEDDSEYGNGSGMYLSNNKLIISGELGRQVIVGTWRQNGYPTLGRFNDDKMDHGGKTGISISVKNGGGLDNVALALNDGIVTGLGFKTKVYGYNSSTIDLGTLRETIGKDVGAVMATTVYYKNGEEKHRDIELTLPTLTNWNEGHIIFIKRGSSDSNTLKIKAGTFEEHKIALGEDLQYHDTVETHNAYLVIDNDQRVTELNLISEGDSCILIFFPTLGYSRTSGDVTTKYKGGWYQWKTPRIW